MLTSLMSPPSLKLMILQNSPRHDKLDARTRASGSLTPVRKALTSRALYFGIVSPECSSVVLRANAIWIKRSRKTIIEILTQKSRRFHQNLAKLCSSFWRNFDIFVLFRDVNEGFHESLNDFFWQCIGQGGNSIYSSQIQE